MYGGFSWKIIGVVVFLVLLSAALAVAEEKEDEKRYLYQWTDDGGAVHITDNLTKVPVKYRSRTTRLDAGSAGSKDAPDVQPPGPGEGPPSDAGPGADGTEELQKAHWQQRVREWKQRLAAAETQYQQLEQQRKGLLEKTGAPWFVPGVGGGVYGPPPEVQEQITAVEREMEAKKSEIESARNMIEQVIPDEARKAGIPPGWLREVQ